MSGTWEAMSEEGRNFVVARAMRWTRDDRGRWMIPPGWESDFPLPHYTTDHNAVAEVRAEVERRGIEQEYMQMLSTLIAFSVPDDTPVWKARWYIFNATPEQQALAFVRACGVEV